MTWSPYSCNDSSSDLSEEIFARLKALKSSLEQSRPDFKPCSHMS